MNGLMDEDSVCVCKGASCHKIIKARRGSTGYCKTCWYTEYVANPDRFPVAKFGLAKGFNGFNNRKVALLARFVESPKCNYPAISTPPSVIGRCGEVG